MQLILTFNFYLPLSLCKTLLLNISNKNLIKEVLHTRKLSLLDHIGFIVRFFDKEEIIQEVKFLLQNAIQEGVIEGLILTGLTRDV